MSCGRLINIPLSVFDVIREYFIIFSILKNDDFKENIKNWRNFCNCSKSLLEIKAFHSYYDLNLMYSAAYVVYNDVSSIRQMDLTVYCKEISQLLNIIKNPQNQIFLNFARPSNKLDCSDPFCGIDLGNNFVDAHRKQLSLVHSIRWRRSSLSDVSFCKNYCFVDLTDQKNLVDVSCLSDVKYLILYNCFKVNDASKLNNLFELRIGRTSICDCSALSKVKKLILTNTAYDQKGISAAESNMFDANTGLLIPEVEDISPLGAVDYLDVVGLKIKTGLPIENTVRFLCFGGEYVEEVGRYTNKSKTLKMVGDCPSVEVALLDGYPWLTLMYNSSIISISRLDYLSILSLICCPSFCYLGDLKSLQKFHLEGLGSLITTSYPTIDYSSLPFLNCISFKDLNFCKITVESPVQHLHVISLVMKDVYVCHSLQTLEFNDLKSRVTIHLYNGNVVQKFVGNSSLIDYAYHDKSDVFPSVPYHY
jgi:hypothetical protein